MKCFHGILMLVFLGIFVNFASAAERPARIDKPEDVVTSLYRDFGWELKGFPRAEDLLVRQPISVLKRYFTPKLAKLIVKDKQEEDRTKELGRLDFEILCGSQDPDGISNIRIARKTGTDIVAVLYDQNGGKDAMTMEFHTIYTRSGWRISDIHYKSRNTNAFPDPEKDLSLLELLSLPD
ncbi:MAG: DUF3828 domain-containing protein [Nitrospirae bacterium]|nr:DUF3828 domain-containing protein [Nitrospirota bacterium]